MIPTKIVFFILWVFLAEGPVIDDMGYTAGWAPARLFMTEAKCNAKKAEVEPHNPGVKYECRRLDDLPTPIVQPKGPEV